MSNCGARQARRSAERETGLPSWTPFNALILLALLAGNASASESPPSTNQVEFLVAVHSTRGVVRCGLFTRNDWLKKPIQAARAIPSGSTALCIFHGIAPGSYGLSAFHDENVNGKLDTNLLGIPSEDYCASNEARGTFGPPSFDSARFNYRGGTKRLAAHMK
jgi:uncharacterized protein (DUF2141 family)